MNELVIGRRMMLKLFFAFYSIIIAAVTAADHGHGHLDASRVVLALDPYYTVNIVTCGDYGRNIKRGLMTLPFAEPYKSTKLALEVSSDSEDGSGDSDPMTIDPDQRWTMKIQFVPRDDEIWPDDQLDLLAEEIKGRTFKNVRLQIGSSADITFKLPGTYQLKIFKQSTGSRTLALSQDIRVAYARRDVIDLSKNDWDNYVEAIWTLKNLSTAEGQATYNCSHFYNIDVFTTMHGVHSYNNTCDQIHYGTMMGFAHQSWMTLMEKALQCVHPSISMPYYNVMKDFGKHYKESGGLKSLLDSPIYGPDYYGGGHANWDNREDPYDPYYVEDGKFANFPLRQNRTGLCDESAGIFDDETYLPACKFIMEEGGLLSWQDSDPQTSGLWSREPRDLSSYKYVSARRWYVYGSMAEDSLKSLIPSRGQLDRIFGKRDAYNQLALTDSFSIHGYAHIALSGLWGGGIDQQEVRRTQEESHVSRKVVASSSSTVLSMLNQRSRLLQFAWYDEMKTRDQGCYKCTKDGCGLDFDHAYKNNCYNINNNFKKLTIEEAQEQSYWSEYAVEGSRWYSHLKGAYEKSWTKVVRTGFGTFHSNTGTFGRHPWANQDPMFYVHHASVFLVRDLALANLVKNGHAYPPFYGLDEYLASRGVPECPGNNPTDTTVFKNLVRYKVGQEPGSRHEWKHIMEMWSPERRDYEWVL